MEGSDPKVEVAAPAAANAAADAGNDEKIDAMEQARSSIDSAGSTAEKAAAAPPPTGEDTGALKRNGTYLTQFEEGAPFKDGWREFLSSLPWHSFLFMAVAAVDVCLVLAYCGWSVNRPGGSIEESLHISLALAVTAAFFFYFVVDGIITENVFELLAAVVLDALVLARVLFYVIAKKRQEFAGRIVLLSSITALQVFVMFLTLWTVLQFGWRIFSRSAIDFRKKDAQERMRLYLSRALFLTLEKLDIQFLIIMTMVAVVIWIKNNDCETCRNPTWFILGYNSVLFCVNILIAVAAWFALKYPNKLRRTIWLDFPLMPISLIQPIANIIWEFKRQEDVQNAKASMAVACGLFIWARLCLWAMRHLGNTTPLLVKHYAQAVARLDQGATIGVAESDRSLLPLIRGSWLGKPSARKPLKRRFFQLSADGTSLRWSWRKYVRLFYLTSMEVDRKRLTLTLKFVTDPDLTLKFSNKAKFVAWQQGIEALVGSLMSPGAAPSGGPGPRNLARPSTSAAAGAEDRRANRNFLRSMVGIHIHDRHATGAGLGEAHVALPTTHEEADGEAAAVAAAAEADPPPHRRPAMEDLSSTEDEDENETPAGLPFSSLVAQDKKQSSLFDPNKLFDFADDQILAAMSPEGGGLARLSSTKPAAAFRLPSGVRGSGLESVEYSELEFGKLLGAGAEGEVYAAWWRDTMVAVKRFNRAADSIQELRMHTAVGTSGDDDCIIPLRGYCRRDNAVYLVMEYCPRGTLDVLIHNTSSRAWGVDKLLPMVRSTAAGVRCLHARGRPVLHRDLKPGNIFVGTGQSLKLGDFGMSRYVDLAPSPDNGPPQLARLTPNVIGTAQYAAPELMNEDLLEAMTPQQRYLQADVYSFGVTLWELLERKRPYKGMDPYQIQTLSIINPEELRLPPIKVPESLDAASHAAWSALAGLVGACTVTAANERPTIEEVYTIVCQIEAHYKAASSGIP